MHIAYKDKGITSDNMFEKKGERTLEEHNVGTSFGWVDLRKNRLFILFSMVKIRSRKHLH